MKKDLIEVFEKFVGREVNAAKETVRVAGYNIERLCLADGEMLISEMQKEANKNGLILRVQWPDVAVTMGRQVNRVNAYLEKGEDGKWRVSPRFKIG